MSLFNQDLLYLCILSMLDTLIIYSEVFIELTKAPLWTSVIFYHFIVEIFFKQLHPFNLNMFHGLSRTVTWLKMDYRCTSSLYPLAGWLAKKISTGHDEG